MAVLSVFSQKKGLGPLGVNYFLEKCQLWTLAINFFKNILTPLSYCWSSKTKTKLLWILIQLHNIDIQYYIWNTYGYIIQNINMVQCTKMDINMGYGILLLITYGYMYSVEIPYQLQLVWLLKKNAMGGYQLFTNNIIHFTNEGEVAVCYNVLKRYKHNTGHCCFSHYMILYLLQISNEILPLFH